MNHVLRPLLAILATCAVLLGALHTPAAASTAGAADTAGRAASPTVAYVKVARPPCSTYTVDGEEQQQCLASFTVRADRIKKGYKVALRFTDHGMVTVVGTFTSKGASASKRFTNAVISYGPAADPTRIPFRVVVKNAQGKKVFTSKPRTF